MMAVVVLVFLFLVLFFPLVVFFSLERAVVFRTEILRLKSVDNDSFRGFILSCVLCASASARFVSAFQIHNVCATEKACLWF